MKFLAVISVVLCILCLWLACRLPDEHWFLVGWMLLCAFVNGASGVHNTIEAARERVATKEEP